MRGSTVHPVGVPKPILICSGALRGCIATAEAPTAARGCTAYCARTVSAWGRIEWRGSCVRMGSRPGSPTIRYTCPNLQRFFGRIPNRQLEVAITYPDQVWVGDITYLKVGALWRYLAVVMDKCSRRIVGWSLGRNKDVQLTLRALNRAVYNRRPRAGLIFHTDRGIEYAAGAFTLRLAHLGFTQSMNRPGKVTDNAFVESFLPFDEGGGISRQPLQPGRGSGGHPP